MAPVCTLSSIRRAARGSIARIIVAAVAGATAFFGATYDADAYVVKETTRGDLVHWEGSAVDYTISPSLDLAVSGANQATLAAMSSWSGSVGAPELRAAPATEASPTQPGFDEHNGVFYMRGGYGPAGRALAITVLTYDNTSGRILDADIIFNGVYAFEVLGTSSNPSVATNASATHPSNTDNITHEDTSALQGRDSVYDLHHVIAHELGHSLGMNDELGRRDALMYRYSAPNDASIRQPAPDDIAGLAELYSTQMQARGNGCSSATVAPKAPPQAASHAAMLASIGMLLFCLLRSRSDRRARIGFVLAAAAATVAFLPNLSGKSGSGIARASTSIAKGHARAKVQSAATAIEGGLFRTSYALTTMSCRAVTCPKGGVGVSWGGTIGDLTQEVGGYYAPSGGDEVDVSFAAMPDVLGPLSKPLAGRLVVERAANVSVVTPVAR